MLDKYLYLICNVLKIKILLSLLLSLLLQAAHAFRSSYTMNWFLNSMLD